MLIKKYRIESYTIHEFLNREEISYLNRTIDHIKSNKKKYMLLVIIIALTVDLSKISSFALTPGVQAIDAAGQKILDLIRRVGYWIAIILCSKDVLKYCIRAHV